MKIILSFSMALVEWVKGVRFDAVVAGFTDIDRVMNNPDPKYEILWGREKSLKQKHPHLVEFFNAGRRGPFVPCKVLPPEIIEEWRGFREAYLGKVVYCHGVNYPRLAVGLKLRKPWWEIWNNGQFVPEDAGKDWNQQISGSLNEEGILTTLVALEKLDTNLPDSKEEIQKDININMGFSS